MKILRNKFIIGMLCIAIGITAGFVLLPKSQNADVDMSQVVRLTQDVAAGTLLESDMLELAQVPTESVPAGAASAVESFLSRYASSQLYKGESVVSLCTRPSDDPNLNIDMRALLRASLRPRPDVITMAEMRGPEAMDSQEAARTGHTVASTLHANSASQTYARIMTMCQMGGTTVPVHTLMGLIVEAFPIAVFCKQVDRRHRCITEIVEAYAAVLKRKTNL